MNIEQALSSVIKQLTDTIMMKMMMMTMTIKWMVVSLINYTSACMESMQHDNERSFALNHTSKRIPSIPDPMSTNSDGAVSLLNHWCFYNDVRILIYVKFWACKDLLSLKGETHKNFWITYRSKIKKKKKRFILIQLLVSRPA